MRLTALEKEKIALEARLAAQKTAPVVHLHPNLPELYRGKVSKLADALNQPGTAAEAGEIMRGLIDRIVLTPANGVLAIQLFGDLATIAGFVGAQTRQKQSAGSADDPALLSVVAGVGFEPTTFRL